MNGFACVEITRNEVKIVDNKENDSMLPLVFINKMVTPFEKGKYITAYTVFLT